MTKTLADMTPEERAKCVGMWCEWDGGLRIIGQIFAPHVTFCGLVRPNDWGLPATADLELVTPLFDLPRAWNPDGTPPKGKWVNGHMWWNEPGDDIQTVDLIGAECLGTGEMQGMDEWPENITEAKTADEDVQVRRFITEWENTNV